MDRSSKYLAHTMHHMQQIYPVATLNAQKKINAHYNAKAEGNPFKIVALMEGRNETKLETGRSGVDYGDKPGFKSIMYNK